MFAPGVVTSASYAQVQVPTPITIADTELAKLTDTNAGGAIVITRAARLVLNGAVTIGNQAGNGAVSNIECAFQMASDGDEFATVGVVQSTESVGNSNHDERYTVPLVAVVDRPAGTYDIRIVCLDSFPSASTKPTARAAAFSVIAIP